MSLGSIMVGLMFAAGAGTLAMARVILKAEVIMGK
jgi:hypothetical protein